MKGLTTGQVRDDKIKRVLARIENSGPYNDQYRPAGEPFMFAAIAGAKQMSAEMVSAFSELQEGQNA